MFLGHIVLLPTVRADQVGGSITVLAGAIFVPAGGTAFLVAYCTCYDAMLALPGCSVTRHCFAEQLGGCQRTSTSS